jgi:peptidoglycan hydrolase-like protein with peptidoglycan-binding domain
MDPAAGEDALNLTRAQRVAVQQSLSRIGHDVGSADGSFGPVTRRAIADWQQSSGQRPTGYLTKEQLSALSRPE